MDPFGAALLDFHNGNRSARVTVRRDDDLQIELPASLFFRAGDDLSSLDRMALDHCQAPVLDVGAGAGCHSLILQERGLEVLALEISPLAAEVLRKRGVHQVTEGDGLDRLLSHLQTLLLPGGQILCDSMDVRSTTDPRHLAYHRANQEAGRYLGEVRIRAEYGDQQGPWYGWLHVDAGTLAERAAQAGCSCEILHREAGGDYLARITPGY
jgi:SAM-dependent methyltransferase